LGTRKLAAVATDVLGKRGRALLQGLFDRLATERLPRRYVQRLEQLGYTVTITPVPAA
jgi:hypothetical protein